MEGCRGGNRGLVVSVQAYYSNVLMKTWLWLCEPCGSLQTVPCVSRMSQGLNSGAQLRPPNLESNQKRSVGTSCLTGPWPRGPGPMSGSCTVLWPTYQLMGAWQLFSYEAVSTLHSRNRMCCCCFLTCSPIRSELFYKLSTYFLVCCGWIPNEFSFWGKLWLY